LRGGEDLAIENILFEFYAQRTVCDVLYVFLCSTEYYLQHGSTYSVLYNFLFGGFIPSEYYGLRSEYSFGTFLHNHFAPNVGGGLFFSEGMLAFGGIGVLIYLYLLAIFIKYLFTHKGTLQTCWFLLMMIMMCRIIWYGMLYLAKPFLFFFITIPLLIHYLKNSRKKYQYRKPVRSFLS
jgi:hypothetical protein